MVIGQGDIGDYQHVSVMPTLRVGRTPAKDGTGITVFSRQQYGGYITVKKMPPLQRSAEKRPDEISILSGSSLRRITPLEALRAQGFPDDWFDGVGLSDTAKYEACGDSIAVPVGEWLLKRMMQFA